MVIFLRSIDCKPDPRVQKYVDALNEAGEKTHILCWDRSEKYSDEENISFFRKKASYGAGIQNYKGIINFNWFLIKRLYKKRKSYNYIHACDFDTILPALTMKLFWGKKIIYDIFDWFVDGRHFTNKTLKKIILFLEKIALKYSDVTIICDKRRETQINYSPSKLMVLPNIPSIKYKLSETLAPTMKLKLSYVGTMPSDRGLEKILTSVSKHPNIELNIAGFGIMAEKVKEFSDRYNNINYLGIVPYNIGLNIMSQSDIIIATYEKTCRNNIYAAPNKYYEGLFLAKPILTTEGTIVADSTIEKQTGFVVGETQEDYDNFFNIPNLKEQSKHLGINAKKVWKDLFENYVEKFMKEQYLPLFGIEGKK